MSRGEIVSLATVAAAARAPRTTCDHRNSFWGALQTASFREVERWKYLSVTVTGSMLRAVEHLTSTTDTEAAHGAKIIIAVCLMFLLGTAAVGFVTVSLSASSLVVPIGLLMSALWLCCRYRYRRYQT
jgi:uncharacterized membrane protein YoaK (UPF0700 family)